MDSSGTNACGACFICVGWDEVGDLRSYESKDAFVKAFGEVFHDMHPTQAKQTEKARELWSLVRSPTASRLSPIVASRRFLAWVRWFRPAMSDEIPRAVQTHRPSRVEPVLRQEDSAAEEVELQDHHAKREIKDLILDLIHRGSEPAGSRGADLCRDRECAEAEGDNAFTALPGPERLGRVIALPNGGVGRTRRSQETASRGSRFTLPIATRTLSRDFGREAASESGLSGRRLQAVLRDGSGTP